MRSWAGLSGPLREGGGVEVRSGLFKRRKFVENEKNSQSSGKLKGFRVIVYHYFLRLEIKEKKRFFKYLLLYETFPSK